MSACFFRMQDSEPVRRAPRASDGGERAAASERRKRDQGGASRVPRPRMEDAYGHTATFECGHAPNDDGGSGGEEAHEGVGVRYRDSCEDGAGRGDKGGGRMPERRGESMQIDEASSSKGGADTFGSFGRSKAAGGGSAGGSGSQQAAKRQDTSMQLGHDKVSGKANETGASKRPASGVEAGKAEGAGFVELLCGGPGGRWQESTDETVIAERLKAAARVRHTCFISRLRLLCCMSFACIVLQPSMCTHVCACIGISLERLLNMLLSCLL
jgi:hypothetical protein